MLDVPTIVKRAAEKSGFRRSKFADKNLPTSIENVVVMPFFGDLRSTCVLSYLLLRRIREELKSSRYFILASWPGFEGLFPYVDEYWVVEDEATLEKLRRNTRDFDNTSSVYTLFTKSLNHWFYDVLLPTVVDPYYNNGIQQEFFDKFKNVKVSLPTIQSTLAMGVEFAKMLRRQDLKVFLRPSKNVVGWRYGRPTHIQTTKEFWIGLVEQLIEEGYFPVIYRDLFSHDLSPDVPEKCLHIWEPDVSKVLGAMRACDCILDVFDGISRLAIAARTPFILLDERDRFNGTKEFEIDDLCGLGLPREYIFGFTTIIESGDRNQWKANLYKPIIAKLNKFLPSFDKDILPSTAETYEVVPYEKVRKQKTKKFGTRFIQVKQD